MEEWWEQLFSPVRRAWRSLSHRLHLKSGPRSRSRTKGGGLLKLRDEVQTCGYQDVQVMWEMLRRIKEALRNASEAAVIQIREATAVYTSRQTNRQLKKDQGSASENSSESKNTQISLRV